MFSPTIENETIEQFYYEECKSDEKAFIDKIAHFIKLYKMKNELNQAFKEAELIKKGEIEESDLKDFIEELRNDI